MGIKDVYSHSGFRKQNHDNADLTSIMGALLLLQHLPLDTRESFTAMAYVI